MTELNRRAHEPILMITLLLTFLCAVAAAQNNNSAPPPSQQLTEPSKTHNAQQASKPVDPAAEGEKRFEINCGRCHRPPDNISPRISKSILQHMRVRAMLTQEDEYYILKYIAP
jgi:cytochrome c5